MLVLVACGGGATKREPAPPEPPVAAGPEECTSSVESAKAGNHDRFAFQDPDGLYGYKNKKGDVVIAPRLRYAYEFKPGGIAAAVDNDSSFVFIDTDGKVIARAFAFDNGPDYFQEGHARIVDDAKKVGFINERGEITIAPQFDEAESFCGGKAAVREAGKQLYIDKRGQPTTPPAERPAAAGTAGDDGG